ncbi:hypothetical protein GCM10009133_24930 [Cocleimonas flava]|uniref:Uncharacterized protein n=1 Tax=Cocleimonas flava TaxID=634765 RepID=A0A4R1EP27_9GAMM|nr:hypothetical protein [Cocleimonas flava]TCJ83027.1 hypothetical protein EV695_3765 [Cocleimonas flava]
MLYAQNSFIKVTLLIIISIMIANSCYAQQPKYPAAVMLGDGDNKKMFVFNKLVNCSAPKEKTGEFDAALVIDASNPFPKMSISGRLKSANVVIDISDTVSYKSQGKIKWFENQGFYYRNSFEHWENGSLIGKTPSVVSLNCFYDKKSVSEKTLKNDGVDSSGQVSAEKLKEAESGAHTMIRKKLNEAKSKKNTVKPKAYATFMARNTYPPLKMKSYHLDTFNECRNPSADDNTISIDVSAKYDETSMKITGTLESPNFDISLGEGKVFSGKGKFLQSKNDEHTFHLSLKPSTGSKATQPKTFTGGFSCSQ